MKKLLARDIMTRNVVTVPDDMAVAELGRLLTDKRIGGAPVLDRKGHLVGVVSVTDIVSHELKVGHVVVSEHDYYGRPDIGTREEMRAAGMHVEEYTDLLVRDIMSPIVLTAEPDATPEALADLMGTNRIHRVLVVEGEKLVGVVSALDLVALVPATSGARAYTGTTERPEVLWATDLGPDSHHVGRRAVELARDLGARLAVLHITPDLAELWQAYGQHAEVSDLQKALEEQALERLHDVVERYRPDVEIEVFGRTGEPAGVILRVIAERRPAFVVIGTQRPASERISGLGSVAEKVLVSSVAPVVTVPRER